MRDAGEHFGALLEEAGDAFLHAVEGDGGAAHFGGAFGFDGADITAEAEGFGGFGEFADGAHLVAHEERGEAEHQQGGADQPQHEDFKRGGEEALAGGLDA